MWYTTWVTAQGYDSVRQPPTPASGRPPQGGAVIGPPAYCGTVGALQRHAAHDDLGAKLASAVIQRASVNASRCFSATRLGAPSSARIARPTHRLLSRVHYPELRAVGPDYATETTDASMQYESARFKIELCSNVYARVHDASSVPDGQQYAIADHQVSGIRQFGGRYAPSSQTVTMTGQEWRERLELWRATFNAAYFAADGSATYPGNVPPDFKLTTGHQDWLKKILKRGVDRDDASARTATTVTVNPNGLLVRNSGELVDTSRSITWFSGVGWEIYVLSATGVLHLSRHVAGRRHHSSLLGTPTTTTSLAVDAAAAGEIKVFEGKVEELNNKSGHYTAGDAQMRQIVHHLRKNNASIDGTRLTDHAGAQISDDALQWWEGASAPAGATYEQHKLKVVYMSYLRKDPTKVKDLWIARQWTGIPGATKNKSDNSPVPPREVRQALKAAFGEDRWIPTSGHGTPTVPVSPPNL